MVQKQPGRDLVADLSDQPPPTPPQILGNPLFVQLGCREALLPEPATQIGNQPHLSTAGKVGVALLDEPLGETVQPLRQRAAAQRAHGFGVKEEIFAHGYVCPFFVGG
ncbi:MAG TPA: hypothetical protein VK737_06830 [Opitutales bacterium]|nr:hypothetical protein [Opitutales bacterium]